MIKKKAKTYYAKLHISENKYFLFFIKHKKIIDELEQSLIKLNVHKITKK